GGHASVASAGAAGTAVDGARAAAGGAGTRHREETLGETHLPLAATRAARLRPRAFLLARATAGLAALVAGNLKLALEALGCLLEGDLPAVLEGVAPARAPPPPPPPPPQALPARPPT